jgi:hypothetical protein
MRAIRTLQKFPLMPFDTTDWLYMSQLAAAKHQSVSKLSMSLSLHTLATDQK